MIKPGDVVTKVEILKDDNIDDEGYEGYEITIIFTRNAVTYRDSYIEELEDQPRGIYEYDGSEYKQIENWD